MVHAFPDMRVVLMSATVDTSMFAQYFGNCQIIEVFGRQHPVQRMLKIPNILGPVYTERGLQSIIGLTRVMY